MFAASGGSGPEGGGHRLPKGIMEHKVMQNLRAVSGDKLLFRQWHQKVTTALEGKLEVHVRRLFIGSINTWIWAKRWRK